MDAAFCAAFTSFEELIDLERKYPAVGRAAINFFTGSALTVNARAADENNARVARWATNRINYVETTTYFRITTKLMITQQFKFVTKFLSTGTFSKINSKYTRKRKGRLNALVLTQ